MYNIKVRMHGSISKIKEAVDYFEETYSEILLEKPSIGYVITKKCNEEKTQQTRFVTFKIQDNEKTLPNIVFEYFDKWIDLIKLNCYELNGCNHLVSADVLKLALMKYSPHQCMRRNEKTKSE